MKERELLTSATRLIYSIKNLSSETRLHWSELLRYIFHNELNIPEIKASEIAAALRPFKNSNEVEYKPFCTWCAFSDARKVEKRSFYVMEMFA